MTTPVRFTTPTSGATTWLVRETKFLLWVVLTRGSFPHQGWLPQRTATSATGGWVQGAGCGTCRTLWWCTPIGAQRAAQPTVCELPPRTGDVLRETPPCRRPEDASFPRHRPLCRYSRSVLGNFSRGSTVVGLSSRDVRRHTARPMGRMAQVWAKKAAARDGSDMMVRVDERSELGGSKVADPVDPLVTVVIPTRDRWDVLPRMGLKAALAQLGVSFEIVIVDDGSIERPPPLAAFTLPNVRLVQAERHSGPATARNIGIAHARGRWLAFLDDDDLWAPGKLSSLVQALRSSGADFAYSSGVLLDAGLRPIEFTPAVPVEELFGAMQERCAIEASGSNVVASAALLARIGGFNESFSTAADWEMLFRLAKAGRAVAVEDPLVAYCPAPGYWKRISASGMSVSGWQVHPEVSVDWSGRDRWVAESFYRAGRYGAAASRYLAAGLRHRAPRILGLSLPSFTSLASWEAPPEAPRWRKSRNGSSPIGPQPQPSRP